jgi:hypothetical protein
LESGSFLVSRSTDSAPRLASAISRMPAPAQDWLDPFGFDDTDAFEPIELSDLSDTSPHIEGVVVGRLIALDDSEDATTAIRPMSRPTPLAPAATLVLNDAMLQELRVGSTDAYTYDLGDNVDEAFDDGSENDVTEPMRRPASSGWARKEDAASRKAYRLYELSIQAYRAGNLLSAKLQAQLASVMEPDNRVYRLAVERFNKEMAG